MANPLLTASALPDFDHIKVVHIEPALDHILADNRARLKKLLTQSVFTWENLMQPIETMEDRLDHMWSPVRHLHSVMSSDELRDVYQRCLSKLTEYHTDMAQNKKLYQAVLSLDLAVLNDAQKKVIHDELRDFKLAGVALAGTAKKRFASLQKQHAKLSNKFENNVLDATMGWEFLLQDAAQLAGIPEHARMAMQAAAKAKAYEGYLVTLDFPTYNAVMRYAACRDLRKITYEAYVTRASDQGPNAGEQDNSQIMQKLLRIRREMASLLAFPNYAAYSLETKMADSEAAVLRFLNDLARRSKKMANQEFRALKQFALDQDGIKRLHAWDMAYYGEKLKKATFDISQEELRPYFPEPAVLTGLFQLVEKLFGVRFRQKRRVAVWHTDVKYFEVRDQAGKLRGGLYVDLYARPNKRSGAWMDECRVRRRLSGGSIQRPVAYLTCNFRAPLKREPCLMTPQEVLTLFHELGHCLHHLLTQIEYPEISGINGVEWDAVELPSQFMENFFWEKSVLRLISEHHITRKKLPKKLYERLLGSKHFQAGMSMMRQLIFSKFDFVLHQSCQPKKEPNIQECIDRIRKAWLVSSVPKFNRFQHTFLHIFAGSYAAGYYSYKWAEVLSSDAFARFEEEGIYSKRAGKSFLKDILEAGGSQPMMDLFVAFRGRQPEIDALLRHAGICPGVDVV